MSNDKNTTTIDIPGGYPITITPKGGKIIVAYGSDKTSCDDYDSSIQAVGSAIMHAIACEGKLPAGFEMNI